MISLGVLSLQRWQGAAATIIPHPEDHVWGVLWELDREHEASLDRQEGVPSVYNRKEVEVECEDGSRVTALTYFLIKPEEADKRPSAVYKVSGSDNRTTRSNRKWLQENMSEQCVHFPYE